MLHLVGTEHTDRRRLVTLTLAGRGIELDEYVSYRRGQGDSWVALSERLRSEYGVDVPQATLHRWYRTDRVAA